MGRRFSVQIDIKVIVLQLTVLIISYSCPEVKRFFHDIVCRFFAFFLFFFFFKQSTTAMTTLAQLLISCIQEKEREIPLLHL